MIIGLHSAYRILPSFKTSPRRVYTLNIMIFGHQMFLIIVSVIIIGCFKKSKNGNIFVEIAIVIENFFN